MSVALDRNQAMKEERERLKLRICISYENAHELFSK